MLPIGENLKKFRKSKGLTQGELAEAVGVSQTALAAWERGRNQPSIDKLIELSEALGTSLDALCGKGLNTVLTTKADVIAAIKLLESVGGLIDFTYANVDHEQMPWQEFMLLFPNRGHMVDWWLEDFFVKRLRLESAMHDGLIDEEVLNAWEEKQMKQFSQELIEGEL